MGAYIPALVWVISGIICHFIARKRNIRTTVPRQLAVVFLGPFAIPLVYLFRPEDQPE